MISVVSRCKVPHESSPFVILKKLFLKNAPCRKKKKKKKSFNGFGRVFPSLDGWIDRWIDSQSVGKIL